MKWVFFCVMEIKIVEESKNKLVFDIKGEGHGFCNALKTELWKDKHVKVAAYRIDHPLIGIPRFIVETDGDARDVLVGAAKKLGSSAEKIEKQFSKELK